MSEPKSEAEESRLRRRKPVTSKSLLALACALAVYLVAQITGIDLLGDGTETTFAADSGERVTNDTDRFALDGAAKIREHFGGQRYGVQVEAGGEVVKLLADDTYGDKHQLFLVELSNGLTVKLSHNIDIAPRIPLKEGDFVRFYGEYDWNEKGGVVHWTHRNTRGGSHEGGWVLHEGRTYH